MGWYLKALMNYADFGGRARRKEFWGFTIVHLFVSFVLTMLDAMLTGSNTGYGVLFGLYWLATLLPALGVAVRRLHDTGRSGLWILIAVVPVIGWLVLLFFYVLDSEAGPNRFGPNPKLEYV